MRTLTNTPLLRFVVAALLYPITVAIAADWQTDFDKAQALARRSNRYLLVDFSGSDWCGWCMKLDREVFSRKEFKKFAKENLVLALIDFPRQKPQSKKVKRQNEALAQKFGVKGFPTILLLSPNGDVVGRTGYRAGGPEAYVEHLRDMIEKHRATARSKGA